MTAFPPIAGIILFIYLRPHEIFEWLSAVPFLYILIVWSAAGMFMENSRRTLAWRFGPWVQTKWIFGFVAWCVLALVIRAPGHIAKIISIFVALALYLIMAYGVQTVRNFKRAAIVLFICGIFVAFVGFHQNFQPFQCIASKPKDHEKPGVPTGRPCQNEIDGLPHDGRIDCYKDHWSDGLNFECEHAGLCKSNSVGGGRVRYIGVLADPNELALATSMALPFAFAFLEERRNWRRILLLVISLILVAAEVAFTKSRGGQLVFGAVLGAYFVKRYGLKRGLVAGAAMVAPMLALGGRSGAEADQSTIERLEAASAGIKMCMTSPIYGQGYSEFMQHHKLTAHNAYMLAAGELGIVGMTIFLVLLLLAVKIPLTAMRFDFGDDRDGPSIRSFSMGMLASMTGCYLGILFLSWTYHYILWMHFGLAGALYGVVKSRHANFDVKVRWLEIFLLGVASVAFVVGEAVYVIKKGYW